MQKQGISTQSITLKGNYQQLNIHSMKKNLLLLALAATSLVASADKVVFIADGSQEFYTGDATQKIITYSGKIQNSNKKALFYLNGNFGQIELVNTLCTNGAYRIYKTATTKFKPNAGVTIKTIKIHCQSTAAPTTSNPKGSRCPGSEDTNIFSYDDATRIQTYTLNKAETVELTFADDQCRASWIEVDFEGNSTQVAAPVAVNSYPAVQLDKTVKYTCSTEGAKIQYSTTGADGSWVDYPAEGIKVEKAGVIYTKGVKEGMTDSFVTNDEYFPVAEGTEVAEFCFNDWNKLPLTSDGKKFTREDLVLDSSASGATVLTANSKIDVPTTTFKQGNVSLTFGPEKGGSRFYRSWTFGGCLEIRCYGSKKAEGPFDQVTITVPETNIIENVVFMGAQWSQAPKTTGMNGDFMASSSKSVYVCSKGEASPTSLNLEFNAYADSTPSFYIEKVYVYTRSNGNAAVGELADENAPVVYYNLQGVKVANPANGVFIRRQGSKVTKVVM